MNDLDLRAALHRDADLVGEPSPDLLDDLVRRRSDQRRQRAGLIAVAAAVAVIAAGIPVGASLIGRSHAAPATQTSRPSISDELAPTTSPAPTTAAPSASEATPSSIVTAWVRQSFHGLSFVVPSAPVSPRIQSIDGDPRLGPKQWQVYNWNNPFSQTAPPVQIIVQATDDLVLNGQSHSVDARPTTVPGADRAFYQSEPLPYENGRPTATQIYVYVETPNGFYSVSIVVPRDSDGDHVAQEFVQSIRVTASTPPCDWTAIDAALPADTAQYTYTLVRGQGELCVGSWAAAGYSQVIIDASGQHSDGQAGLFRYVDGAWTFMPRLQHCNDPGIPHAIWERACNVD